MADRLLVVGNHIEALHAESGHYYGATIKAVESIACTIEWDDPADGDPEYVVLHANVQLGSV